MSDINLFANLGIGGVTLFIIWTVVKYFMAAIDKKDEYLKTLIDDFQTHVEMCNTNFIKSSSLVSESSLKQAEAINLLIRRVTDLEK